MKTVFVGLSGGVDSAVSAAILKEAGYVVVGAFIKIWRPEFSECPWREDRLDAMRVAAALGIPFREIDLSEEYKSAVIDDMVRNYARGVTPNPDVLCNRHIKFGSFAKWAFAEGADLIATGHYARNENRSLMRGLDASKDQSYFLYQLTADDLARVLFPVGGMPKKQVRELAEKFDLPVAKKSDSQGLCFVGDVTMAEFLGRILPLEKGVVLDESATAIGEHDGAALYTPGARHGFRVAATSAQEVPHFVTAIDTSANTITVSTDRTRAYRARVELESCTWVTEAPQPGIRYAAQARYREAAIPCTIDGTVVSFDSAHLAPAGQSLVIYSGDTVVGGGIIAP